MADALELTLLNSFYTDTQDDWPYPRRVAFTTNGNYCAVACPNWYGPDAKSDPTYPAEVWVFKRTGSTWAKIAALVTDNSWSHDDAGNVAISDNLTVLTVGGNTAPVHRWKSTGTDTWAADSWFYIANDGGATYGYDHVALSADGNVAFFTGTYNGSPSAKIWTGISGTQVLRQTISDASDGIMLGVISSDGKRIIMGRHPGYSSTAVQVWNSTTLGTNSWTLGSTLTLDSGLGSWGNLGLRATSDLSIVAAAYEAASLGEIHVGILQHTTGSTYVKVGHFLAEVNGWDGAHNPAITDAGNLLIGSSIDNTYPTPDTDTLWSELNVLSVGSGTAFTHQHAFVGLQPYGWVTCLDISPDGLWACVVGNGEDSPYTQDTVLFFSVAEITTPPPVSEFWTDFVKSAETL